MFYKMRLGLLVIIVCTIIQDYGPAIAQRAGVNRDSVAVIIGNRNYKSTIDVDFAHNDAEDMQDFLIEKLGFREGNIIFETDATKGVMEQIFGDTKKREGKLWDWVRNGRSNVFVYYSGHGAPDLSSRPYKAYLILVDGDPNYAHRGYSRDLLEQNLKLVEQKIGKNRWLVLMLDACFTGASGGGSIVKTSLPGIAPQVPGGGGTGIIRINATSKAQVANWDENLNHGLLTGQFLLAAKGAADKGRHGNKDGKVTWPEIKAYVSDNVSYLAKRRYGRDQSPELSLAEKLDWHFPAGDPERDFWVSVKNSREIAAFKRYLGKYPNGKFVQIARIKINELTPPQISSPPPPDPKTIELAFWNSIKDSRDPAAFKSYLRKYSNGDFVDIVRLSIKKLTQPPPAPPVPPTPAPAIATLHKGEYFIIAGSYQRKASSPGPGYEQAWQRAKLLLNAGFEADVIDTNQYPNLTNWLWAVVIGPYDKPFAKREMRKIRRFVPDAYVKRGR